MQIKEIPLGQVLMLGLPIFLMVIGIAAIIFLADLVIYATDYSPKFQSGITTQSSERKRNMVRTEEFISWTRPDGHSTEVDKQINAYIREHDISAENLIDIKYTAYVEENNEAVTQALLIYKE